MTFSSVFAPVARRLVATIVAGTLVTSVAGPAAAASWTREPVTEGWLLSRPSMAVESDDAIDIVYQRSGSDPGLFFSTGTTTGPFVEERLTSGDHWAADFVLDPTDHAHIAYTSFGADAGVHYLTDESGPWVDTRVTTAFGDGEPSIALDASGKVHIVYPANDPDPGIFYLTNESGAWVKTRLVSSAHDLSPDLVIDGAGKLHVAFARFAPEAPGLYYVTRTAGTWSTVARVTSSYDDWPALAVDSAGKAHMAFERFGPLPSSGGPGEGSLGELHVGTDATGSWTFERLYGAYTDFIIGPPDVAFDGSGDLHVVVRESSRDPYFNPVLRHYTGSIGAWAVADLPTAVHGGRVEFPSMDFDSFGVPRVAYRSFGGEQAGIFLASPGSSALVAASHDDAGPAITSAADGTRHLSFDRANAGYFEHGVHYGDEAGGWDFERIEWGVSSSDVSSGPTDLALAPDGSARIVTRSPVTNILTNEGGTWARPDFCCGGTGGSLAVDSNGKTHMAITNVRDLTYATDAQGTWQSVSLYGTANTGDLFEDPAIAVDALGRRHVLYVYRTTNPTLGLMYMTAAAGGAWPAAPTRLFAGVHSSPDAVVDAANKLHIAWIDHGTSPGIYYATNASGSWVRTRLSRSTADGPPSIAIDPSGKILVAFARGFWAATPGMYLVSNRSGSWKTLLVSDDDQAGDPSLDVGPDGLADIAYVSNDGVSILVESETAVARVIGSAAAEGALAGYRRTLDRVGSTGSSQATGWPSPTIELSSSATDTDRFGGSGEGFRP